MCNEAHESFDRDHVGVEKGKLKIVSAYKKASRTIKNVLPLLHHFF